jgi:hypothetical protein
MGPKSEIYRAVLEYDHQPTRSEPNPHYDPNFRQNPSGYDRNKQPWSQTIQVPDGPVVPMERMIGPYVQITPIKAYVSRNRGRYQGTNLRIKRIERVSAWEEVENY